MENVVWKISSLFPTNKSCTLILSHLVCTYCTISTTEQSTSLTVFSIITLMVIFCISAKQPGTVLWSVWFRIFKRRIPVLPRVWHQEAYCAEEWTSGLTNQEKLEKMAVEKGLSIFLSVTLPARKACIFFFSFSFLRLERLVSVNLCCRSLGFVLMNSFKLD